MAVLDTVQEHGKAFWMRFPAVSDKWEKRIGDLRAVSIPPASGAAHRHESEVR